MKTLNSIKHYAVVIVVMTLMITAANAQRRYNHLPRVKVEKHYASQGETELKPSSGINTVNALNENGVQLVTTTADVIVTPATNVVENTTVVTASDDVEVVKTKTVSKTKIKTDKKKNTQTLNKFNPFKWNMKEKINELYTKKLKENSKLLDVKDTKKSQMARWLLLMIIFLGVGLLLIILAVIFTFTYSYGLYVMATIFYIIGSLLIVAGLVFMVLGLTGVMS